MMKFENFFGVSAGLCSPAYEIARRYCRLALSKATLSLRFDEGLLVKVV